MLAAVVWLLVLGPSFVSSEVTCFLEELVFVTLVVGEVVLCFTSRSRQGQWVKTTFVQLLSFNWDIF